MRISPGLPPLPDATAVPAVDHAGGVARLMGDAALFARVLGRFRKEYRQAAAGIRQALDAGDLVLAQRRAHTLKGAAGMIEAVPLGRQAQRLEHLLRAGSDGGGDVPAILARLQEELDRVLGELDALAATLPERPAARPARVAAQGRHDAREDALERLAALLDEGNGDAVDLVRDAAAALGARLGQDAYREVAQAVESFDFDGALELLRRAAPAG
ncbi:Hpt domain-containing protein [uncultured Massilia sp.]|uniref:Hpt domain-containing protein n=1 Tax=uncultured Massilia sp. TaxID=169973 RepID=UPI0025E4BAF8|nr:Hpt domain-containing protein [uncultured Massilia sp.]